MKMLLFALAIFAASCQNAKLAYRSTPDPRTHFRMVDSSAQPTTPKKHCLTIRDTFDLPGQYFTFEVPNGCDSVMQVTRFIKPQPLVFEAQVENIVPLKEQRRRDQKNANRIAAAGGITLGLVTGFFLYNNYIFPLTR